MLRSLYISSFVLIDDINIEFHNGMNVLTGETGAGKSIIIDALSQLCGQRSSVTLIKKGQSKAIIEAIFDIHITQKIEELCEDLHIPIDDQFVIRKEIFDSGKSLVKINYQLSSNAALKQLVPLFLDIHSQFETQKLFYQKNHIVLLDQFAFESLKTHKELYEQNYANYKQYRQLLKKTIEEDMSDEQLDFLMSQAQEIDEFDFLDEDIDEMENELKMLENYEKMSEDIKQFDHLMSSSQGAFQHIKEALGYLAKLKQFDDFDEVYDQLYNNYYEIMDNYETTMDIYRGYHFDEYRFNELQETLFKINRLKRKYGFTMERIHEYREEIEKKILQIQNRDSYIQELKQNESYYLDECMKIAKKMHNIRKEYALKFEKSIENELADLYLKNVVFKVKIHKGDLTSLGFDDISFMVSMNKGQDLSLLTETASGGEISRLMLAIKTVILQYQSIETVVFDEIDTGVSGKVASSIGDKMKKLSQYKQVFCITHLPQVARFADNHYYIQKTADQYDSSTNIYLLDQEQRIIEIAKMLSGEKTTPEAISNAKKLLCE